MAAHSNAARYKKQTRGNRARLRLRQRASSAAVNGVDRLRPPLRDGATASASRADRLEDLAFQIERITKKKGAKAVALRPLHASVATTVLMLSFILKQVFLSRLSATTSKKPLYSNLSGQKLPPSLPARRLKKCPDGKRFD